MNINQCFFLVFVLSLALVFGASCDKETTPVNKIIELEVSPADDGPANGSFVFTFTAKIPEETPKEKRKINFTTTAGVFTNQMNTIEVEADISPSNDGKLHAEAKLVAPGSIGVAEVAARVLDSVVDTTVSFTLAGPTALRLSNSVPAISANPLLQLPNEVFLEGTLLSSGGVASSGVAVDFIVENEDTGEDLTSRVRFRNKNMISNSKGKVSGFLYGGGDLGVTPFTLKVTFEEKVNGHKGAVLIEVL